MAGGVLDLLYLPFSYACLLPGGTENSEPRTHRSHDFPHPPTFHMVVICWAGVESTELAVSVPKVPQISPTVQNSALCLLSSLTDTFGGCP
jgi:hypothetical protein